MFLYAHLWNLISKIWRGITFMDIRTLVANFYVHWSFYKFQFLRAFDRKNHSRIWTVSWWEIFTKNEQSIKWIVNNFPTWKGPKPEVVIFFHRHRSWWERNYAITRGSLVGVKLNHTNPLIYFMRFLNESHKL